MKNLLLVIFTFSTILTYGQDLEKYGDYDTYQSQVVSNPDKIYVINYWATWCGPCVKEMKYFEQLDQKYKGKGVEVVLVSIDFENQYDRRLVPFVAKRKLQSRVVHMYDPKTNVWIDKVDPSWSGAIPATQIIHGDKKIFMERSFEDLASLEEVLLPFLSK